jgi:hypothetical protein
MQGGIGPHSTTTRQPLRAVRCRPRFDLGAHHIWPLMHPDMNSLQLREYEASLTINPPTWHGPPAARCLVLRQLSFSTCAYEPCPLISGVWRPVHAEKLKCRNTSTQRYGASPTQVRVGICTSPCPQSLRLSVLSKSSACARCTLDAIVLKLDSPEE